MLTLYTDYISVESLASYYVNTPDPRLNDPPCGQRLVASWNIPVPLFEQGPIFLRLKIRFKNLEEETFVYQLNKPAGSYSYCIESETYCCKGEIVTFIADLESAGGVLCTWKHHLWAERITFPEVEIPGENIEF